MSNYSCADFRRDHRYFCNEFAPILRQLNMLTVEEECETENPIEERQFSCCCRRHRHHHHQQHHQHHEEKHGCRD